jgi:hypothetical protein
MERMMVTNERGNAEIVTKAELLKRCRQKTFDMRAKGSKALSSI